MLLIFLCLSLCHTDSHSIFLMLILRLKCLSHKTVETRIKLTLEGKITETLLVNEVDAVEVSVELNAVDAF